MPRAEKVSQVCATRKSVRRRNKSPKPDAVENLDEDVILKPSGHANERGKAKEAPPPCDFGDFNAPDLRRTPDSEDSSKPASQQAIRDTVDMMATIFREIKRYEHEIARQHKLANELGEVAQRLRQMATLQVEQTRRLEEKLRYYRKAKVCGWEYEEVFGSYDARLKVQEELGAEIDAYDVDRGPADII